MPKRKTRALIRKGKGQPPRKATNQNEAKSKLPATKKKCLGPIPISRDETDPIIGNLKLFTWNKRINFNLKTEILDQIALEGLSGITFARLSNLLDAVCPNLNCVKDAQVQAYVWSAVTRLLSKPDGSGVRVYRKPQVASAQSTNKRKQAGSYASQTSDSTRSPNKNLLVDKEIKLPKDTLSRISRNNFSLFAVQDGNVMGSCRDYLTRENITYDLISLVEQFQDPLICLHKLNEKYDLNNVHFVADQEMRRRALLPNWTDPNIDIKMREYACLEFIGRTRSLGVVFPNDKALGRYRILLTGKKLISQYQPKCTSHIVHHIIRFSRYVLEEPEGKGKIFKGPSTSVSFSNEGVDTVDGRAPHFDALKDDISEDKDIQHQSAKKVCCNPLRLKVNNDMLKMVYQIIAHSKGRSPLDIRRKLRLPKFHVRNHLKNLSCIELIGSHINRIDDQTFRIYRARHKSLVYRARLRERSHRKKLKSLNQRVKFDEIDIRAKTILGNRRSQFSQAEDSLLILCRICCLLLEPKLTKKVSFCVSKRFVRDLLHDELVESHDKTADACLRRIKYLRKLPNNIMSINEWTAELRDDKDIVRMISLRNSISKSEERLNKLFMQVLKAVRAKLPQLLGIASGNFTAQKQSIMISSYQDLKSKYELIDCQTTGASRYKQHPGTTILQLAQPIEQNFQLNLSECNEVNSIALLTSVCSETSFDLELKLKIPSMIVGLDQGNENYKQLCAKAKESTRELLDGLSSSSTTADSRRALFMLRNELKQQALDKCGNLADALIVQPCNVRFLLGRLISFKQQDSLLRRYLSGDTSLDESEAVTNYPEPVSKRSVDEVSTPVCRRSKRQRRANSKYADSASICGTNETARVRVKIEQPPDPLKDEAKKEAEPQRVFALKSLIKSVELLLSWIFVMPGIELEELCAKVKHSVETMEGLLAQLDLMKRLGLITEHKLPAPPKSNNVGIFKVAKSSTLSITYEPSPNSFLVYSQLISLDLPNEEAIP